MKIRYGLITLIAVATVTLAEQSNDFNADELDVLQLYGDEDFISIATGVVQPIAKAPAVASVITASEIKSMGATDIDQVLETVPGLHVGRDVIGYNSLYTFRGIYADFNPQVLMLVNGQPITNLFQGDRNVVWGGMPVEAISRIEVIRGPGSALYGADAFAGVINIVTKSPKELQGLAGGVSAGSYSTKRAWLSAGGSKGELKYSAFLEAGKTDGSDATISADAQTFFDLITGTSVSNAPGRVNLSKENLDLRLEANYKDWDVRIGAQIRNDVGDGAGAAQALNRDNKFESDRYNIDITYREDNLLPDTKIELQASYYQTSQEVTGNFVLFPAGSTGPFISPLGIPLFGTFPEGIIGNPEIYENHFRTGFTALYDGIDKHNISFGSGYYNGEIDKVRERKNFGINPNTGLFILPGDPVVDVSDTPLVFLTEDKRDNNYAYVQDVWQLANDWELTAGLRHDKYSDFGSTTNPRLALVWSTGYKLTTKLLYGEAFRAPSFAQTRAINNPLVLGNPDLKPEEITSYELAFDYRPSYDLTINMNFFLYNWTDIIQFVSDMNGSTGTAHNVGEQTGRGMEFEVKWIATDDLKLSGNFSIQKSEDELLDADAANSPERQLYLRGDWRLDDSWTFNAQANWVMGRNRESGDSRPVVDDYLMVDMNVRHRVSKHIEVALIMNNIFDEDAREPSPNGQPVPFLPNDLPLSGRSFLGEIRYTF
jgi:outer membrane receptor for ferrienterochelin and colicin|tara:strand:- start:1927 stop:4065 length:2139 start_codon:yes stop_codon:yes gene_type:complete